MVLEGVTLWNFIRKNRKLKNQEIEGFKRGTKQGKTYENVPIYKIMAHLEQHYYRVRDAVQENDKAGIESNAVHIRNIAGVMFLRSTGDL